LQGLLTQQQQIMDDQDRDLGQIEKTVNSTRVRMK
jgi:hypothetical protein